MKKKEKELPAATHKAKDIPAFIIESLDIIDSIEEGIQNTIPDYQHMSDEIYASINIVQEPQAVKHIVGEPGKEECRSYQAKAMEESYRYNLQRTPFNAMVSHMIDNQNDNSKSKANTFAIASRLCWKASYGVFAARIEQLVSSAVTGLIYNIYSIIDQYGADGYLPENGTDPSTLTYQQSFDKYFPAFIKQSLAGYDIANTITSDIIDTIRGLVWILPQHDRATTMEETIKNMSIVTPPLITGIVSKTASTVDRSIYNAACQCSGMGSINIPCVVDLMLRFVSKAYYQFHVTMQELVEHLIGEYYRTFRGIPVLYQDYEQLPLGQID